MKKTHKQKEPLVEELENLTIITVDDICFILNKKLNFLSTILLNEESFQEKIVSNQMNDGRPVLITKYTPSFIYVFLFHYKMKLIFNSNGKYIDYISNINCLKAIEELNAEIENEDDKNEDDDLFSNIT